MVLLFPLLLRIEYSLRDTSSQALERTADRREKKVEMLNRFSC
jgi:hypothetical protein